jgi:16S rRNA pseudouridine516 synthase
VLLFTDDGALIHRLTLAEASRAKVYEVGCRHAVEPASSSDCAKGVLLHDENETVRAAACEATGPTALRLYARRRQVPPGSSDDRGRGNRVEVAGPQRFRRRPVDALAPGAWRWLSEEEPSP